MHAQLKVIDGSWWRHLRANGRLDIEENNVFNQPGQIDWWRVTEWCTIGREVEATRITPSAVANDILGMSTVTEIGIFNAVTLKVADKFDHLFFCIYLYLVAVWSSLSEGLTQHNIYLATYFLRVTVLTLRRSQPRNISYPFTYFPPKLGNICGRRIVNPLKSCQYYINVCKS